MRTIFQDLRYGIRLLVKSPVLTIAAMLSLAIGIGANTAIFSFVNELLLRPLPVAVKDQKSLVRLFTRNQKDTRLENFSYPDYVDYKDRNPVFSDILAYTPVEQFSLQFGNQAEYIYGSRVSGNFFSLLGVQTGMGRSLAPDDDREQSNRPVAIISYRLWTNFFNGDSSVIGREVQLNRVPLTIIGIMPERFTGILPGVAFDIYVPLTAWAQLKPEARLLTDRKMRWLELIARLKPGIGLAQARAAMQTRALHLQVSYPDSNENREVYVSPINQKHPNMQTGTATAVGGLLAFLTILVLLIACSNIANLLLGRAIERRKEIVLRAALGASRSRIMRQLLTEAMLLSFLGGAAGLILAGWLTDMLASAKFPMDLPIAIGASLDGTVLCFTATLTILTGLLFGTIPALHVTQFDLTSALKDNETQNFKLFRHFGARNLLVTGQIAGSLVMLIMAGLMLQSLRNESKVDFGFKTDSLLMVPLHLDLSGYSDAQSQQFNLELFLRLESLPEIYSASRTLVPPLSMLSWRDPVFVHGYNYQPGESKVLDNNMVGRGYFKTLNIPFVRGRDFSGHQKDEVVINETMERHYWPGQAALGREIEFVGSKAPLRVIGVVKDSILAGAGSQAKPVFYVPISESYRGESTVLIRGTGNARKLAPAIRQILLNLDPGLPIPRMRTLSEQLDISLMQARGAAILLGLLGLLALGLASIGLYGVVSYAIGRRTREIGIHIAIGAQRSTVLRRLMSEGVRLTAIGLVIGFIMAQVIAHAAQSALNGIRAADPLAYVGACLLLGSISLLACYMPARKALKADPMSALRCE